jgi:hypothetical protein
MRTPLVLLSLLATALPAQTVTLTASEVLRIHFVIPGPPAPSPDVLFFGLGLVTVNSAYTARTAQLYDCDRLLGTAVSPSFGGHTGLLSLGVANSFRETGSIYNFDNPGDVADFSPLRTASIQGVIDFTIATGALTLDLANVSLQLMRASSANGGNGSNPQPLLLSAGIGPRLDGPLPGSVPGPNTWFVTGGVPNNLMFYGFGFACSPLLLPLSPPVMFDIAPLSISAVFSDANGASSLTFQIPAIASGLTLLSQCAELVGPAGRVSNFVRHTF